MVLSKHGVLMIDSRVVEFYDIYWHIKFWQELMIIGGKMGIGLGVVHSLSYYFSIQFLVTNFWFVYMRFSRCERAS